MENKLTEQGNELSVDEVSFTNCIYLFSNCKWYVNFYADGWKERKCLPDFILSRAGRKDWIKPILKPISKIAEGEAFSLAEMEKQTKKHLNDYEWMVSKGRIEACFCEKDSRMWQLLIKWGYAVPLFFGLNHWANGKTAIDLGIAIDKTIQ